MIPFYWNALHAVEKYLKAVLLLNEQSAICHRNGSRFSHNIELLYDAVQIVAGEFLPEQFSKPDELGDVHWWDESMAAFVQRLNGLGTWSEIQNKLRELSFSISRSLFGTNIMRPTSA